MKTLFIAESIVDESLITEHEVMDFIVGQCSFDPEHVEQVDGGWMCFESADDFDTWSNQI